MDNKYSIEITFRDKSQIEVVGVGRPSGTESEIQVIGADGSEYVFLKKEVLFFTLTRLEEGGWERV